MQGLALWAYAKVWHVRVLCLSVTCIKQALLVYAWAWQQLLPLAMKSRHCHKQAHLDHAGAQHGLASSWSSASCASQL